MESARDELQWVEIVELAAKQDLATLVRRYPREAVLYMHNIERIAALFPACGALQESDTPWENARKRPCTQSLALCDAGEEAAEEEDEISVI